MTADRLLSLCKQHRTLADLPSLTSPPKNLTIGAIGMSLASMPSLNLLFLRTRDQSCAGIRTPRIARDEPRSSSTGSGGCTHLLHCTVGKSSSVSSSTTGSAGWFHVSVLVISPPGIGITVSPLTIDLKAGLPSSFLLKRCDA